MLGKGAGWPVWAGTIQKRTRKKGACRTETRQKVSRKEAVTGRMENHVDVRAEVTKDILREPVI